MYTRGPGQPALAAPALSRRLDHTIYRGAIRSVIACGKELDAASEL